MSIDFKMFEKRAEIIKAMANAARLVIVESLSASDRTVGELTDIVDLDISTVSRHLLVLRNAGIVSCRRDANRVIYHLRTPCVLNFMSCVEKVIAHDAGENEDSDPCVDCV